MKIVTNSHGYDGWLIENNSDLLEYVSYIEPLLIKGIKKLIRGNIPPERWDHINYEDEFTATLKHGLANIELYGGNPIYEICKLHNQKIANFIKHLDDGKRIFINHRGGYCFYED